MDTTAVDICTRFGWNWSMHIRRTHMYFASNMAIWPSRWSWRSKVNMSLESLPLITWVKTLEWGLYLISFRSEWSKCEFLRQIWLPFCCCHGNCKSKWHAYRHFSSWHLYQVWLKLAHANKTYTYASWQYRYLTFKMKVKVKGQYVIQKFIIDNLGKDTWMGSVSHKLQEWMVKMWIFTTNMAAISLLSWQPENQVTCIWTL